MQKTNFIPISKLGLPYASGRVVKMTPEGPVTTNEHVYIQLEALHDETFTERPAGLRLSITTDEKKGLLHVLGTFVIGFITKPRRYELCATIRFPSFFKPDGKLLIGDLMDYGKVDPINSAPGEFYQQIASPLYRNKAYMPQEEVKPHDNFDCKVSIPLFDYIRDAVKKVSIGVEEITTEPPSTKQISFNSPL